MKRTKSFVEKYLLYLVATPIGNLSELSPRAQQVLSESDIIAAEDTRNTEHLLSHFNIKKPLFSLREHNEIEASKYLIEKIKDDKKVVYVSDAGYPGISDPGYLLVKEAIKNDIAVSTVSGPSAFLNSLVASGLATNHFYFHGFISAKDNEAKNELKELAGKKETLIFYEAPHRIKRTLSLLLETLGNREATLARELTKMNEEYIRGTLSELNEIDEKTLIGEFVIIVSGKEIEEEIDDEILINEVNYLVKEGMNQKAAIEYIAKEKNVNKNRIKKLFLK